MKKVNYERKKFNWGIMSERWILEYFFLELFGKGPPEE